MQKEWLSNKVTDMFHNLITLTSAVVPIDATWTCPSLARTCITPIVFKASSFRIALSTAALNLGCRTRSGSVSSGNNTIPARVHIESKSQAPHDKLIVLLRVPLKSSFINKMISKLQNSETYLPDRTLAA